MPYASFLSIHFEVGDHTESLEHQALFWPTAIDLLSLANRYSNKLTLQFNPQWAEYIVQDRSKLDLLRIWQRQGHEIGLHHHGYDHGDWNGFTNRPNKKDDPRYRGNIKDMMELMRSLIHPYPICTGTISDEEYDYPHEIKYDTEGIHVCHARSIPKQVTLGNNNNVIQVGMAFLSFEGVIESFKCEYKRSNENEIFGLVTHEKDFAINPTIIEDWFKFLRAEGQALKSVNQIIPHYKKTYPLAYNNRPMTFMHDVVDLSNSPLDEKG